MFWNHLWIGHLSCLYPHQMRMACVNHIILSNIYVASCYSFFLHISKGETWQKKITRLREKMAEKKATVMVLSSLDEVACRVMN